MKGILDKLFFQIIKKKLIVIRIFQAFYLFFTVIYYFGAVSIYYSDVNSRFFYQLGVNFGRLSVILFIITLIPGIFQKFDIRLKIITLLRIFRRHLGISMYLTAFTHYSFVKLIPMLSNGRFIPFFLFEIFGILALFVSFLLFATSNDISMKKLGVWWYRLHRLVYPGMIFILLHLALMRFSVWTILMITLTISFVTSTLYEKLKSKKE